MVMCPFDVNINNNYIIELGPDYLLTLAPFSELLYRVDFVCFLQFKYLTILQNQITAISTARVPIVYRPILL